MGNYLKIYGNITNAFGFQARPIGTFFLIQLRQMIDATTRSMDHLFYPGFRNVEIDRPIFIIGNPRSGTTFLHRFLLESERLVCRKNKYVATYLLYMTNMISLCDLVIGRRCKGSSLVSMCSKQPVKARKV